MRIGFGVDQLRVDADLVARALDASLDDVANTELAADPLCVDRLALECESGAARNHEHVRDPRQIGRDILGKGIGEMLLIGVVAEIDERQHDDRQARRRAIFPGRERAPIRGHDRDRG
jgi:hypothetical protein